MENFLFPYIYKFKTLKLTPIYIPIDLENPIIKSEVRNILQYFI